MRLSSGIYLALLSGAATIVAGFSLKHVQPTVAHISSTNTMRLPPKTTSSFNNLFQQSVSSLDQRQKRSSYSSLIVRGGSNIGTLNESSNESGGEGGINLLKRIVNVSVSFWAAGGVVAVLGKSIKRIVPIALEPFGASSPVPLSTFQLGSYIAMCLWFAYVEGYKGFQQKFSPLVVARAQTLKPFDGTPIHHILFGPFYAMGLFHATKKRKIVSWSVSLGVGLIVAIVKKIPYPWRNIVDAGVIVGLSWGSLSILGIWMKTVISGKGPDIDPALPEVSKE